MMTDWESKLIIPDGQVANYHQEDHLRKFKLIAEPIAHNILPEITIDALGYNASTPGPMIVVKQGEWVSIEVENRTEEPTTLHVHGLVKPNSQDGRTPIEPSPKIKPGESYTYKFQAWQVGTFFYHSTENFQENLGLVGAFLVLPNNNYTHPVMLPDRDYTLIVQQWQIEQPELGKVFPGTYKPIKYGIQPNFFTINGKCYPETTPLHTTFGERLRIRFINKSSSSHSMHTHGHDFNIVEVDGFPRTGMMDDTISLASGKRIDVEILANNPGKWPINGTKTFHESNNGHAPGGMITQLIYDE
ncbi:multicopper oxidase domain-containing protein [Cytobacillus sp. S13-E01]|uniref:multicopper oxidase family protein n=1 Tax=Cytobacillus sp. S13-E01 TaxID=3031326 RepID=UPI0023D7D104|nr:multicopper oxidase domain-containing protein [Cytobacillus sp. S13-E01]MDF0725899.1 multicopper oxidase domain-containing protein [Cytobacillus sp. S13-E01]